MVVLVAVCCCRAILHSHVHCSATTSHFIAVDSFPDGYMPYGGGWQSFVNAPARTEILTPGTTHVAVGFVDLGGLAAACEMLAEAAASSSPAAPRRAQDQPSSSMSASTATRSSSSGGSSSSSGSRQAPHAGDKVLQWVGYEMSPYCVAKALVLLAMLEQGAPVDTILQVRGWWAAQYCSIRNLKLTHFVRVQNLLPQAIGSGLSSLF